MSTADIDAYDEEDFNTAEEEEDTLARPAVKLANQVLNQAMKSLASDVHIEPHEKKLR